MSWASRADKVAASGGIEDEIFEADDRLIPMHPVYVIPYAAAKACHDYFANKLGF